MEGSRFQCLRWRQYGLRPSAFIAPVRFVNFLRKRSGTKFKLLDIGCGNHSPSLTKYWFPGCVYHGVDCVQYNNSERDVELIDSFYCLDLNRSDLRELPDASFDVVIASHVIEHLEDGMRAVRGLAAKVAANGDFYLEFPSPRSLKFPSARHTLYFHDDPTHVRPYSAEEVATIVMQCGLKVVAAGRRRYLPYLMLLPLAIVREIYSLVRYRQLEGPPLYDLLGYANYVYAVKDGMQMPVNRSESGSEVYQPDMTL